MENYSSWGIIVTLIVVFACILPIITIAALVFFGAKWVNKLVTPAPIALKQKLNHLRRSNPELGDDQLVKRIIDAESFKAGLVGALTGLGGLPLLPLAIPIDFALSARIQATLIHFIAYVYAPYESEADLKIKTVAIMAGSEVMKSANKALQAAAKKLVARLLVRTIGKSVLEAVPVIGAVVGFGFNWFATQSIGQLTVKWYKNELQPPSIQAVKGQVTKVRDTTVNKAKGIGKQVTGGTSGVLRKAGPGMTASPKKLGEGSQGRVDKIGGNLAEPVDGD